MAKKGGAKSGSKGKKEKKPQKPRKLYTNYTISGNKIERKNKTCPKCGPGMFLGKHKNRVVCGKCSYVEMNAKKKE
ncbi:30S ribosomal protein S27ae [Candidatus Woesearchaeota archaeon CG10_big_fil_rev_8_21_14_0_10_36_11]|nr:MAG: 30S ribosomal protein S27ae [Candidatus Woesearchaeota archaeon CG10_big_fil_rev_8_21_14_0_10_36_11]